MKKILILTKRTKPDYQIFIDEAKPFDAEVTLATFDELVISVDNIGSKITLKNQPLSNFDVIYLRTLIRSIETQSILSHYCHTHHLKIVDQIFQRPQPLVESKITDTLLLQSSVPIVPSLFLSVSELSSIPFAFPWIIKITDGSQGRGVHLVSSLEEATAVFNQYPHKLMVQPYLENQGDVRAFVINGKVVAGINRIAKSGEFRNNVSQGGSTEKTDLTEEQKSIAVTACNQLGYDIAGVDLIFDSHEASWKVLEVNRAPQYHGLMKATGVNIPKLIIEYLSQL